MEVDEDWGTVTAPPGQPAHAPDGPLRLQRAVASLYSDLRLTPTLHALLAHSRDLVGGVAGSISVIDAHEGTYSKVAERGIACRVGGTFSLTEGATGHAFAHRGSVVIDDYSAISSRHLPPDHPANGGSVVAVPIWWRGDLIGVNVAFAGRRRTFTAREIDRLDVLTQSAAGAIVTAGAGEPSLARLIRDRVAVPRGARSAPPPTEAGDVRPVSAVVEQAVADLVASAERAAESGEPSSHLHVAIVHRARALRLLVQEERTTRGRLDGTDRVREAGIGARPARAGGAAEPADIPGRGTSPRADIPGDRPTVVPDPGATSPLTRRETEVLALAARGLGDREIARRLVLSPKTVEKHVGSAIRKTGTASRTGAAVRALANGWI